MPIEMALWRLNGNEPTLVGSSSLDTERRLEEILENDISILGLDRLLVIGRQVATTWGKYVDLLALDPQGDLVVIELKRDRTPREVVAQALDYGSWAKDLDYERLADIYGSYRSGEDLEMALKDAFGDGTGARRRPRRASLTTTRFAKSMRTPPTSSAAPRPRCTALAEQAAAERRAQASAVARALPRP